MIHDILTAVIPAFVGVIVALIAYIGGRRKTGAEILAIEAGADRSDAQSTLFLTEAAQKLLTEQRQLYLDVKKEGEEAQKALQELRVELRSAMRQIQHFRKIAEDYNIPDSAWLDVT